MCNLYRLSVPLAEISTLFDAASAPAGANLPAETYPGSPGIVIAAGQLRSMVWDFPLALSGKQGGAVPYKTPVEFPTLSEKYASKLDWDGKVGQHEIMTSEQFKHAPQVKQVHGGGGTDPTCVTDYLRDKKIKPDAVVDDVIAN